MTVLYFPVVVFEDVQRTELFSKQNCQVQNPEISCVYFQSQYAWKKPLYIIFYATTRTTYTTQRQHSKQTVDANRLVTVFRVHIMLLFS